MSNNDTYTPGPAHFNANLMCIIVLRAAAVTAEAPLWGEAGAALGWIQLIPAAPASPPQGTAELRSKGDAVCGKVHLAKGERRTRGVKNEKTSVRMSPADTKVREKGGEEVLHAEIPLQAMERTHAGGEKQCGAKKD